MLSEGLRRLAFLYLVEGDLTAAWPLATEALTEAREIGSATQIFLALLVLTWISCLRGDQSAAKGYCLDVFALARDTGSAVAQFGGLLASGFVACFDPDASRGVRLMTAIPRFAEEFGMIVRPAEGFFSLMLAPAMEKGRANLDPTAFEAAKQEGLTLELDQALELAIAG